MQPKFTLKKITVFLQRTMVILFLGLSMATTAQTVSSLGGTGYGGDLSINNPAPLNVSFVIQNTTGAAVALTDVTCQMGPFGAIAFPGDISTNKLYMSTTSLSGGYNIGGAGWSVVATGSSTVPAAVTAVNCITGANVIIPAGVQYRFVLELTKGIRISGPFAGFPLPTPNSFTVGGIVLKVGDNQIAGQNVGWGGLADQTAGNTPAFYGGAVTLVSTVPCSGTPNPGNTLSSVPTVCPGVNFTLSPQNSTAGSGVTYQWQSSASASGPWANLGTGPTQIQQQSAPTYYRVIVTCGANSGTSTPIQVLTTPTSGCYCDAGGTSAFDEKISNVTFGSINNSSTATTPYTSYTALSTNVVGGQTLPISVSISTAFTSDQILVWIDFNQDGDFIDAGEQVYVSAQGVGPHNGNITIPTTATIGSTRMRVRLHDAVFGPLNNPCGTAPYGEVEDYTVNIQPCVQGQFTTGPANVTIQCSNNASFSVTTVGSALNYSWEYKVSAASPFWLPITNTGVYSGATTSTLTLTNVPSTMNGYVYRAVIQGPCTGVDVSSAATLTVNPLVATVNPTSATICTGSIQALSLTNASSPTTVSFSNNTPLPIPDASGAGVYSTIAVAGIPAGAVVTNVSVKLNIPDHTYVGDLEINLIAPNNVSLNLIGELDGGTGSNSSDGFVNTVVSSTSTTPMSGAPAPRTGTFAADRLQGYGPSGNFQTNANGMPWSLLYTILNGNWRLGLSDWFGGDTGTLTDWTLTITYGAPAAGIWTSSPAAPNTMFTDPAATVPYVAGTPATTIYVNPTVNTNYSVVYSTATPCTSAPTVIPVTVVNPVTAVVNPVNTAACVGNNATFTVSAGGGPLAYQWQVSSDNGLTWTNVSGGTAATLTVAGVTQSMNNYRYRAVISAPPCGGSTNSGSAVLTVNALPVVTITSPDLTITPGPTTTITGTSSPAATAGSWTWTLDGSAIPGTSNTQVVGIDGLGTYRARAVDANGCAAFSNNLTISAEASDRLWIYPNPSAGNFQVRLYYGGPVTERRVVRIFKTNGQLVMEKEFTLDNVVSPYLRMDFDLNHLAAGTYVVKVDNTVTGKITSGLVVIQHD